jgi:hypothetical protein
VEPYGERGSYGCDNYLTYANAMYNVRWKRVTNLSAQTEIQSFSTKMVIKINNVADMHIRTKETAEVEKWKKMKMKS